MKVDSLSMVRFWFGTYYNINEDFKGHTRSMMPLGKGAVVSYFLNGKIKCEMLKINWICGVRWLGAKSTFEQVFYIGTSFNSGYKYFISR